MNRVLLTPCNRSRAHTAVKHRPPNATVSCQRAQATLTLMCVWCMCACLLCLLTSHCGRRQSPSSTATVPTVRRRRTSRAKSTRPFSVCKRRGHTCHHTSQYPSIRNSTAHMSQAHNEDSLQYRMIGLQPCRWNTVVMMNRYTTAS